MEGSVEGNERCPYVREIYSVNAAFLIPPANIRKRDTFGFPGSGAFSASFNKMSSAGEEPNPKHFSWFPFLKSILLSPSTVNDMKSRGETRGN